MILSLLLILFYVFGVWPGFCYQKVGTFYAMALFVVFPGNSQRDVLLGSFCGYDVCPELLPIG